MNWKDRVQIVYLVAATISAVGAALAAVFAAFVFRRNSALETVQVGVRALRKVLRGHHSQEFIAFLKTSKQLKDSEIEALFGYYLDCLNRHDRVKQYIENPANGYEGLAYLLKARYERSFIPVRHSASERSS